MDFSTSRIMELAELEIFRAVAAEQSVTRAARTLERAQSNVTTRIKQLESSLGVSLFHRDSKRMTLTPEGERLLGYADQLLTLAEEARQSMRGAVPSGTLRVGSMESTAAARLPKPLMHYHAAWPDVSVEIQTGTTGALVDDVLNHRLDCALVAHPGTAPARKADMAELGPGLDGTWLYAESLVLVLPAGHPAVHAPDDLRVRQLAVFARGCTYRGVAEAWLQQGSDDTRRQLKVQEMPSYHAILASVSSGAAVGIVPRSLLALQRDESALQVVPLRTVHTYLIRRAGFSTIAFDTFLKALRHG